MTNPGEPVDGGITGGIPGSGGGHGVHADYSGLTRLEAGLRDLAGHLEAARSAESALPTGLLHGVLGAIGSDFLSALDSATARHREVVGEAARTTSAAADVVAATWDAYATTDESVAAALHRVGPSLGHGVRS